MTTIGLPYLFEDTTGFVSGPADFLDIYDRPPFLRLESTIPQRQPSGRDLEIFELETRNSRRGGQQHTTPPSVVISLYGAGLRGSIRFRTGLVVQLERWLKKSAVFGSTLTRQFIASDGICYQWSFRKTLEHEWSCVQLDTNYPIAHYDLKPPGEPPHRASGNVLTVHEHWIHLAVEVLASLVVMRHIQADVLED